MLLDTNITREEITMKESRTNVCRLCLANRHMSNTQLFNIFEYSDSDLPHVIEACVGMQISKDDGLSSFVCLNCIQLLMQFNSFKEVCYNSYVFLTAKLAETKSVGLEEKYFVPKRECSSDSDIDCDNDDSDCIMDNTLSVVPLTSSKHKKVQNNSGRSKTRHIDDTIYGHGVLEREGQFQIFEVDSIRAIIGDNIYVCDICSVNFDTFLEYFDHQFTHDGQFVFKCDKCYEVFSERKQLVDHDLKHKIPCEVCKLEVLPKSMAAHLLIHTDVHKCTQCGMRHTSNSSLEKHIKARHAGIKGFVCHVCGKQSSCQSSMNRHMAYHSNDRPYKCKYCDFSAKSLNIVQVHTSRKHFAEKCVCEICAKIFKSQPSLIQHMKRIHTARKHICDICGKAFIERYNLTKHLKRHPAQRLHECKICHKEFFTVRKLKDHMHSHRQGCVNCPKCAKAFFYKKYFNKHILKCTEVIRDIDCNI